jgi:tRNA1Val (adenine37-N6)-methyltransferase
MAKNSFFRFKQFVVNQDRCAMKVCTDACTLGAWAGLENASRILDIGTGTGLLALMAAQRNPSADIDAVELDAAAFSQASENVRNSIFASRIRVLHHAVQDFTPDLKYDCIITNPPFFQADLRSPDAAKNLAHHASSLSFDELLISVDRLLTDSGSYYVLLPTSEAVVFSEKAEGLGWKMTRNLILSHDKNKKPFRHLMRFQKKHLAESQTAAQYLYIYEENGKIYHSAFKELLKDFYLIF